MPDHSLDEMLERLYAADPADFIALRKQLQGELRSAGMKPEAALLAKARRPSTAMWAVNQLVRRRPELVESLLERSQALRDAQTKALSGDRDAMRDAMHAHRAAIEETIGVALEVLGPRANDSFRDEIATILRAASAQPEIGRELRAGRLVRTDDTTPGFPDLGDVAPAPAAKRPQPRAESPSKKEQTRERESSANAEREAEAEAEAERQAQLEFDRALEAADAADEEIAETERRIETLTDELAGARRELREARTRSRAARAEADRRRKETRG